MGEDSFLNVIAQGGGIGSGIVITGFFGKWLLNFITGRMDKREARLDDSTARLIEGLEKRLNDVTDRLNKAEAALDDCKRQHYESEAEVNRLRGIIEGMTNEKP